MQRIPSGEQRRVIDDLENNIILYASAGTGKTFTVAEKVKKILENNLAAPEEILCLTFTIKACDEMHEDILRHTLDAQTVAVRTIHSFCYELIKEEAKRSSDNYIEPIVCDDVDQEEILKQLIPQRISAWRLEEFVTGNNIANNLSALFEHDAVYLPRDYTPLNCTDSSQQQRNAARRLKEAGFFWKIDGNQVRYINLSGTMPEEDAQKRLSERTTFLCPECRKRQFQQGNFCTECGFDFRTYIPPKNFLLGRYGDYRNLISLLKHARIMYGYISQDEALDYARTFAALKQDRPEALTGAFTCKREQFGRVDEALFAEMETYAGRILHEYSLALRQSNRLDFDDLIIGAHNLLKDGSVLARWQARYKYIIIDEMQDTSELEYDVLRPLFAKSHVMMCGDFFQTIYEWRGSKPYHVLEDFRKNYNATVYMLSENYRSTEVLTHASFGYLASTYPALLGKYCPERIVVNSKNAGSPIRIVKFQSMEAEANFIFQYLKQHPTENPSNVCIMSRSNSYIAKLAKQLYSINRELPVTERLRFFTVEQDYRFFKRPAVKDILALWTLLVNRGDAVSMERLAEKYIPRVGPATLAAIRSEGSTGLCSFLEADAYESDDPYRTLTDAVNWGNVVVYDIETTGLDLMTDEIIQIAAMKIDRDGNPVSTFERFVFPTVEISKDAMNTHGYSLDFIKNHGGMSAIDALKSFSEFTKGSVLVGHNSTKFDRAIIDRQLGECGLPPLDIKGEYDTLTLSKLLCPELANHKLGTLCSFLGIVNERAHDAFADVAATAKLVSALALGPLATSAAQRQKLTKKYRSRFQPFYLQFCKMQEFFQANRLRELNEYIRREFHLDERYERDIDRESLDDLFLLAEQKMQDHNRCELAIRDLLTDSALAGSQMDILIEKLNKIPIITVHQSKGCEFDTVLLAGVDNNNFPNFFSMQSGHGEEEARVFYVALSRAKHTLVMTCCENASKCPSPYIRKIPQDCIEWYRSEGGKIVKE